MRPVPHLVFIPGTLCDERLWTGVLSKLNGLTDFQTINWSLKDTSASEAAQRILSEVPSTFALVGMSMGGSVALEICAQAAHRVEALALVSCQPRGDFNTGAAARSELLSYAEKFGISLLVRERLWPRYVHPSRLMDHALLETVMSMAERAGIFSYRSQLRLLTSRRDHVSTLASLTVPVAVVAGDNDLFCPPPLQAEMMSKLRFGTRTEIGECGHMSPLERPESVAAALSAWLGAIC